MSVVLGAALDWRSDLALLSLDLAYQRAKVEHMRPMVQLSGVTAVPDAPKASSNYGQDWNYTKLRDIFGILKFEYDISEDFLFYASSGARAAAERDRKSCAWGQEWSVRGKRGGGGIS